LLIVDGDAVPTGRTRGTGDVQRVRDTVEGDRLKQQAVAGSTCDGNDQVVPGIVGWIAGYTRRDPLFIDVVVRVPLMTASDAALVSPNEALRR
jgi:hypothetical protein